MTSDSIGVVVVNYAAAYLIRSILGSVRLSDAVVVIVDNYSSEPERERISALAAEKAWNLVPMADNRGFGPGVNAGVARARDLGCRCFVLLNPDADVSADVIEALRVASLAQPMALISPRLADPEGKITFAGSVLDLGDGRIHSAAKAPARRRASQDSAAADGRPEHGGPNNSGSNNGGSDNSRPANRSPETISWLTAACLAVHQELWDRVGGFDEAYFMYWEDVDFSYRCLGVGAELVLREDLTVVHDQGGTQGPRKGRAKSSLYYFYNARNRMLFAAQHLDRAHLRRWLWQTPKVTWEILLRGGRRQLLDSPRLAVSAARGGSAGIALGMRALARHKP